MQINFVLKIRKISLLGGENPLHASMGPRAGKQQMAVKVHASDQQVAPHSRQTSAEPPQYPPSHKH
jgi:hypothetical protein